MVAIGVSSIAPATGREITENRIQNPPLFSRKARPKHSTAWKMVALNGGLVSGLEDNKGTVMLF